MITLAAIWRHPIKGIGREALQSIETFAGQTLPYDRHWAVVHENAHINPNNKTWMNCTNFARAAREQQLMAITSQFDINTGIITLRHPKLPDLSINPDKHPTQLIEWVSQISNPKRAMPTYVYKADRGLTDSSTAHISIKNNASLDALSNLVGTQLEQHRFRGNLWVDGLSPWEEFNWIGKSVQIGSVEIEITEPITRCIATTIDPKTGISTVDTLGALNKNFGHQNFGVGGIIRTTGKINIGDKIVVQ